MLYLTVGIAILCTIIFNNALNHKWFALHSIHQQQSSMVGSPDSHDINLVKFRSSRFDSDGAIKARSMSLSCMWEALLIVCKALQLDKRDNNLSTVICSH